MWQPIETAPKNGEYVDLWAGYLGRVTDCRFNKDRQRWERWARWEHWWIDEFESLAWVRIDATPSHWMPPPKPPEKKP